MIRTRSLLAGTRALFALSLLGLTTGIIAGSVIVLFRFSTEYSQILLLPGADPENYEALTWQMRLVFTTAGGLFPGLVVLFCFTRSTSGWRNSCTRTTCLQRG